jgi:hypothetical protein
MIFGPQCPVEDFVEDTHSRGATGGRMRALHCLGAQDRRALCEATVREGGPPGNSINGEGLALRTRSPEPGPVHGACSAPPHWPMPTNGLTMQDRRVGSSGSSLIRISAFGIGHPARLSSLCLAGRDLQIPSPGLANPSGLATLRVLISASTSAASGADRGWPVSSRPEYVR